MATCDPPPRSIDEGLDWFLSHNASGSGMCAQHTWHSLGGDRGCPPAWGCANANQVYDKVKKSGRYWTTPKRGDIALWKYGENGHAARVYDDAGTLIATTNPSSGPSNGTGIEPIGYPSKWGATSSARIFTDTYNGIACFTSGLDHGSVYLSKLVYGTEDSDSVRRLQMHLNEHTLVGGEELPVTGNYGDLTDDEVILCQVQHGFGNDEPGESSVGPGQAGHLFTGCACTITDDRPGEPLPPTVPPETETPGVTTDVGIWDWYSGKETDKVLLYPGTWKKIAIDAMPASGITGKTKEEHFLYLRIHLPKGRSATRTIHTRFIRSDGDETAYLTLSYDSAAGNDSIGYPNFHVEKGTGLGGHWEILVEGGTDPIDYTTRYAKTYVTYRD